LLFLTFVIDCQKTSLSLSAPALVTLYLSQLGVTAQQLAQIVALLPISLKHLFLCELAEWDFAQVPLLLARLPRLVYLNMYRSGRPDSTSCVLGESNTLFYSSLSLSQLPTKISGRCRAH